MYIVLPTYDINDKFFFPLYIFVAPFPRGEFVGGY
jgi:hypothetical protein